MKKFVLFLGLTLFSINAFSYQYIDKGFKGHVKNNVYFIEHTFDVPLKSVTSNNYKYFFNSVLPESCYLGHYSHEPSYDIERIVVRYSLGNCDYSIRMFSR